MKRLAIWVLVFALLGVGYNAYHWFDGLTQNRIGYVILKFGKNEKTAFEFFKKSAELGNSKGALNLGLCYVCGHGTNKDLEQAKYWISKSNHPKAEAILANLGVSASRDSSLKYLYEDWKPEPYSPELLEKAKNGDMYAQFALGKWYQEGKGVSQDFNLALKWYKLSSDQGFDKAQNNLGLSCIKGPNPANWGFITAYGPNNTYPVNLGEKTKRINEDKQKQKEGFELIKKASSKNNPSAMNNLGYCFENGIGTRQDFDSAFEWYKKSADFKYPPGQFNLGRCYSKGIGTSKNPDKANSLFEESAGKGFELAKRRLAESKKESSTNPHQNP